MPDDTHDHLMNQARRTHKRRASLFVGNNRQSILSRFGHAVRERRTNLKLTQADLAARTKISRSSISEIELGRENISLERAERLAQALGCQLADLLE